MRRPGRRTASAAAALLALAAFGASALPGFGAPNGTVVAQVNVSSPEGLCITITPSGPGQGVSFGTLPFNTLENPVVADGSPTIQVTSCASGAQTLLAQGTDATGNGALWFLFDDAIVSASQYMLGLGTPTETTFLFLTNKPVGSVAVGATRTFVPKLVMPIHGSPGNGKTMTMTYLFTATV
jgi:hypothetical protein